MTSVLLLMEDYLSSYTTSVRKSLHWGGGDYERVAAAAFRRAIYYGDAYLDAFAKVGIKAQQTVPMCRPLQSLWAREHGMRVPPELLDERPFRWPWTRTGREIPGITFRKRVLDAQVEDISPDVLWVFSGIPVTANQIERWRSHVRKVVLWWSCPVNPWIPYHSFDLILSGIPQLVDHFRSLGIHSEYMPHAFDSRVHDRVPPTREGRVPRVAFVGNLSQAHSERVEFLDGLSRNIDIDFFGTGREFAPPGSPLRSRWHDPVWGDELYRVYGRYALVVHRNIGAAGSSASAKRLFEATGMGACLVAEADPGLSSLFEPGVEVATYESVAECVDVVRHLLGNDTERSSIAASGQSRTLRDHTYEARVAQLVPLFTS